MSDAGNAGGARSVAVAGIDPLALAQEVLAAAGEEQAEALVQAESSGLARFAASEIHQPTLVENASVQLRIVRGGQGALLLLPHEVMEHEAGQHAVEAGRLEGWRRRRAPHECDVEPRVSGLAPRDP